MRKTGGLSKMDVVVRIVLQVAVLVIACLVSRVVWTRDFDLKLTGRAMLSRILSGLSLAPLELLQESSNVVVKLQDNGTSFDLGLLQVGTNDLASARQYTATVVNSGTSTISDLRLEWQLPVWAFAAKVGAVRGASDARAQVIVPLIVSGHQVTMPRAPRSPQLEIHVRELDAKGSIDVAFLVDLETPTDFSGPVVPPGVRRRKQPETLRTSSLHLPPTHA